MNQQSQKRRAKIESLEPRSYLSAAFGTQTLLPVSTNPNAIVVGDVNGDTHADLVVAFQNGNISFEVFTGDGAGNFSQGYISSSTTKYAQLAFADVNHDGIPDLIGAGGNGIDVMYGDGAGNFAAPISTYIANASYSFEPLAMADFNGDGWIDAAVTTTASSGYSVSVLLNQQDGTFGSEQSFAISGISYGVTAGDFNQDNKIDLAVAAPATGNAPIGSANVLLGNGDGTFASAVSYNVGKYPYTLQAGDFNGDAQTDLFVVNTQSAASVLINKGNGTFRTGGSAPDNFGTQQAVLADFTGDSHLDAAVVSPSSSEVELLEGSGTGKLKSDGGFSVGSSPRFVTAGDFNGDGKPDLAVANYNDGTISILLNGNSGGGGSTGTTFGAVNGKKNVKLVHNGVTYTLTGPGTGTLADDNAGNIDLTLTGTSTASVLAIKSASTSTVRNITDVSALGTINAAKRNITGTVTIGTAKKVSLGNITNGAITVTSSTATAFSLGNLTDSEVTAIGGITTFKAASWTDTGTPNDILTAPQGQSITIKGNFNANLSFNHNGVTVGTVLNAIKIGGNVSSGSWALFAGVKTIAIGGSVGSSFTAIDAATISTFKVNGNFDGSLSSLDLTTIAIKGSTTGAKILGGGLVVDYVPAHIKSLKVGGPVVDSIFSSGLNSVDGVYLNGDDIVEPGSSIAAATFGSTVDSASKILAASLPKKVSINKTKINPATDPRFSLIITD